MIHLQRVTVRFADRTILSDLALSIAAGERVALLGPNGAGKTTLIRALIGQVPFEGSITVGDFDVRRRGMDARQLVGYVPQMPAFPAGLTSAEVVAFFQELRGLPADPLPILDRVGLRAAASTTVRALSGGMMRRLALGVALIGDPQVLLLDEPASHLDREGEGLLLQWLHELKQTGRTVLLAAHHLDGLEDLVDRLILLEEGRVIADVALREVAQARWIEIITEPPAISLPSGVTVLPSLNGALHLRVEMEALAQTLRALAGRRIRLREPRLADILKEVQP